MVKGKLIEKDGVKYVVNSYNNSKLDMTEVLQQDLREYIAFNSIDDVATTLDISKRKLYRFLNGHKLVEVHEQRLKAYLFQNNFD